MRPTERSRPGCLNGAHNVVRVPALVKTKGGQVMLKLTADDFVLTDDGVPQALTLDQGTDLEPLALAIVVETGGGGANHSSITNNWTRSSTRW